MTEKDIISQQNVGPQRYLLKVGAFVRAYDSAAFVVARATGYKVRRARRRKGYVSLLAFPADRLSSVVGQLRQQGIEASEQQPGVWAFVGGDSTPDAGLMKPPLVYFVPPAQ